MSRQCRVTLSVFALLGSTPGLFAQANTATPATTAFVHVAVIPMDSTDHVLSDQTVVVRGDRIVALGPAAKVTVPAGAQRVDGRGKYLIPGLVDMHAHPLGFGVAFAAPDTLSAERWGRAAAAGLLYVANGVTTIRSMNGTGADREWRARVARGQILGPRTYLATPMLQNEELALEIMKVDSIVKVPAAAKAAGYDLIKMYGINGVALDTLAAAAHRLGIPIAGHAPGNGPQAMGGDGDPAGIASAIRAGYASIEHLGGFVKGLTDGSWLIDSTRLPMLAAGMRRAGVWSCPTLAHVATLYRYITPNAEAAWPEARFNRFQSNPVDGGDTMRTNTRGDMARARYIVKTLHDAGVGILLGTDDGAGHLPGFMVHRELDQLVAAGLTPYEALVAGTRNPALYFGTSDSTGTIAVGKRADLVLLDGNPLRDISQTTHRAGVMLGGRWFTQADLDQRLKGVEHTQPT